MTPPSTGGRLARPPVVAFPGDSVGPVPMPTPPALADAPVLAHVTRGGVVESAHRGSVAVTAPDGSLLHAWGDPHDPVLPRSSNNIRKPTAPFECR